MANAINIILFITGLALIVVSCYTMFGVLSLLICGAAFVFLSLVPVKKRSVKRSQNNKGGS